MLFDKLTIEDKNKIESYIAMFGGSCDYNRASLDQVLRYWNENKAWLEPYFGDSLIKEIPITYKEGESELENKVYDMLDAKPEYRKFLNEVRALYPYPRYREREELGEEEYLRKHMNYNAICAIVSESALVNNKIDIENYVSAKSYTFTLPNGEKYTVQDGAKPMRVLRKFAEIVGFSNVEFEHFRNDHSCCLQTKALTGILCLSIHPLDFMTMSDNANKWSSCMSWTQNGEYRLGTVEMMNSESIICAYIKSDHDVLKWDGYEWNSKKWRCLYIAAPDNFLLSIKSYPFYNSGLTGITLTEIAKMFNWEDTTPVLYDYDKCHTCDGLELKDGRRVCFELSSNAMYCDFGSTDHWFILGPKEEVSGEGRFYWNYSGPATCMWCGDHIYTDSDEGYCDRVTCDRDYACCANCDYEMDEYSDDWYWVHDERICPDCAEEHTVWDTLYDERIWCDEAIAIYLSHSNKKLTEPGSCRLIYVNREAARGKDNCRWWNDYFNIDQLRYDDEYNEYYVCPKDCTESAFNYLWGMGFKPQLAIQDYIEDASDET